MEIKRLLRSMLRQYPVIYTCTMFATIVYCKLLVPDEKFSVFFLASMMIFALLGDLPMLIFYSSKELTEKKWRIRKIMHFIILECLLLSIAKYIKLFHNWKQGILFGVLIFIVYIIVSLSVYYSDIRLANALNEKIKSRKQNKS